MVLFKKSFPMLEAVIEIDESVASGSDEMKLPDDDFPDGKVESRSSIQEQAKDRLINVFDGVMDGFGEKESAKFMAFIGSKKLSFWLGF